jgi:hypothetical protein
MIGAAAASIAWAGDDPGRTTGKPPEPSTVTVEPSPSPSGSPSVGSTTPQAPPDRARTTTTKTDPSSKTSTSSSSPPPRTDCPNVVGRTSAQATSALTAAGHRYAVRTTPTSDPRNVDIVLSQSPTGTACRPGDTITIVVGARAQTSPPPIG